MVAKEIILDPTDRAPSNSGSAADPHTERALFPSSNTGKIGSGAVWQIFSGAFDTFRPDLGNAPGPHHECGVVYKPLLRTFLDRSDPGVSEKCELSEETCP